MISRRSLFSIPLALPIALGMKPERSEATIPAPLRNTYFFSWDMYRKLKERMGTTEAMMAANKYFAQASLAMSDGDALVKFPSIALQDGARELYWRDCRNVCRDLYGANRLRFLVPEPVMDAEIERRREERLAHLRKLYPDLEL